MAAEKRYWLACSLAALCVSGALAHASHIEADIIRLKNGGVVEGVVVKENAHTVELETGFGTVAIGRQDIREIVRSTPEKIAKARAVWDERRVWLKGEEKQFSADRERRFKIYSEWAEKEEALRSDGEGARPGEVSVSREAGSSSLFLHVLLNGTIKATLVLDTGADIVVLSRRMGESMGIDLEVKGPAAELCLAGGRTVPVKIITLQSIKVGDIEEKDVRAAVILDDDGKAGFRDGLLGQTFLSRFNISLDMKTMKMRLERLK